MFVCLISGLSKWVRQLVQHHDTFSNAMQSLVAFSQGQQKVKVVPVDSQTSGLAVSSPEGHLPLAVEGTCLPKASEPLTLDSYSETPKQDASPSALHVISPKHIKDEQNEKEGESKCWISTQFQSCISNESKYAVKGKQLSLFTMCFVALFMGILKYGLVKFLLFFLLLKHHDQYQDKKFHWKKKIRQTQSQWCVTPPFHTFTSPPFLGLWFDCMGSQLKADYFPAVYRRIHS